MMMGHFIFRLFEVDFMFIKYTCDSKSQTLRMRNPFQSTGRPISHRNGWSFRVYMIPLQNFVTEWNSRPGTTTGVNSRRGDSCRHGILWWYHVNKYRPMRGNQSELGCEAGSMNNMFLRMAPSFLLFLSKIRTLLWITAVNNTSIEICFG